MGGHPDFALEPGLTFLNHGSFGACPRPVLHRQQALRARMEANPVRFLAREAEGLLDEVRAALARFVGARAEDLVFVHNATTGVNAVVRSLSLQPGDELLTTSHVYNACHNVLRAAADRAGAHVVVAEVPCPLDGPDVVVERMLDAVTPRTRLALIDHLTSPTALVFPVERLVPALEQMGVPVLVDGAHSPGHVPLDLTALGASYFTGNLHKWVCAPKGSAFLHARADRQAGLRPAVISHGANAPRVDKPRFQLEFDWVGTVDPTAWLAVGTALEVGEALPGGWAGLMARNHALALEGRRLLLAALGTPPIAPDDMLGAMASVLLPGPLPAPALVDPLHLELASRHHIEVPVFPFGPHRILRISAQRYNSAQEYEMLARLLPSLLFGAPPS